MALASTTDDPSVLAMATCAAAAVSLAKGELPQAEARLAEALNLAQSSNWSLGVATT